MENKKIRLPRKQKKMLKKIYQTPDENWYIKMTMYCGWLNHFKPGSQAKYRGKVRNWKELVKSKQHFSGFKNLNLEGELNIEILEQA